jgi:membrane protein
MRIVEYFREGIWKPKLSDYSGLRRFLFRYLRIFTLAAREFNTDNCSLRASALTFYTLVSLVPIVTMALAIARGFGLDTLLQSHVWASPGRETAFIERMLRFADSTLKSMNNGYVAGIGVVVLFWTVTSALSNIEYAFDQIWEVPRPRRLLRKATDYIAMIVVGTVLLLVSLGLGVALQTQVGTLSQNLGIPNFGLVTMYLLRIVRFLLVWGLFTAGYLIMPNTRVRTTSAIFGGLFGAAIYQFAEWGYLRIQIGAGHQGSGYGGFAALPLFLGWVQVTWMVALFGAELAFSEENVETYGYAPNYTRLSGYARRLLQLRVMHVLVRAFEAGQGPLTSRQISEKVEIPIRLLRRLLLDLTDARIITRTIGADERRASFQPARGADQLTLGYVIDALDAYRPLTESGRSPDGLPEALRRFHDAVEQSAADIRLADITSSE